MSFKIEKFNLEFIEITNTNVLNSKLYDIII